MNSHMKWLFRALILTVTCLSADLIAGAGEPKPDYIRWPYGVVMALAWTTPLWASTFNLSSTWRLVVAVAILLTGALTSFVMLAFNAIIAIAVAAVHLALITNLVVTRTR